MFIHLSGKRQVMLVLLLAALALSLVNCGGEPPADGTVVVEVVEDPGEGAGERALAVDFYSADMGGWAQDARIRAFEGDGFFCVIEVVRQFLSCDFSENYHARREE